MRVRVRVLVLAFGIGMVSAPLAAEDVVRGDGGGATAGLGEEDAAAAEKQFWLDRFQESLHSLTWRTARSIDSWAGPPADPEVYQEASGRLVTAVLVDEHDGIDPKVRFRVDMPLPHVNRRMKLFIGRFNRDEFVSEREEESGAFPFGRDTDEEDETLAGLVYSREGSDGGTFSASAGGRVRSGRLDPYVKTSYRYRWDFRPETSLSLKETVFYQASEKFGLTSRVQLQHLWSKSLLLRWTTSGTISEGRNGLRYYSSVTAIRDLGDCRSIGVRIGLDGDSEAAVPLREFGVRMAYRKCIYKDWLALELRASLTWPKDDPHRGRAPSWGFGIGCEMAFGPERVGVMPVTL